MDPVIRDWRSCARSGGACAKSGELLVIPAIQLAGMAVFGMARRWTKAPLISMRRTRWPMKSTLARLCLVLSGASNCLSACRVQAFTLGSQARKTG